MCAVASMVFTDTCWAGFTFLGPTSYLSAADSPFAPYLGGPDFYLEDFEDGELNTPGVSQRNLFPIFGDASLGRISTPGPETDSVDADDKVLDGLGTDGYSLQSNHVIIVDMIPPIVSFALAVQFDEEVLGYLPNAFGIVWTDGPVDSSFSLRVTTGAGDVITSPLQNPIGDDSRGGTTGEDFFVGVLHPDGIADVEIRGGFVGTRQPPTAIEVDHLQYGVIVPETRSVTGAIVALVLQVMVFGTRPSRECAWNGP